MKSQCSYVCGKCPKIFQGYCTIFAKVMANNHPACELGMKFIKEYGKEKNKNVETP